MSYLLCCRTFHCSKAFRQSTPYIKENYHAHYIMITRTIHQENKPILNVYVPNKAFKTREAKTELRGEISIYLEISTPLSQ